MVEHTSCTVATEACCSSHTFSIAHLYKTEKTLNMHIHDCHELYFSISGGKQFLIDNSFYHINDGDLFLINQFESHCLSQVGEEHERIVLSIDPAYLKSLSTEATDLSYCFQHRKQNAPHQVHLTTEEQKRFVYLTHKLVTTSGFGSDLLDQSIFLELMVFINQKFYVHAHNKEENISLSYHAQMDDLLSYINQNIHLPLTIEDLSSHFYLSSSYLCRIFKAASGTTINKYITAKRISLAKTFLQQGLSVHETCEACGFNDYSNFLKSFTKAVGISPKKYAQFNQC